MVLKNEYTDSDKFYQSHQVNHSTGTELPQQSVGTQITNDKSFKKEKINNINVIKVNDDNLIMKNENSSFNPRSTKKNPSKMKNENPSSDPMVHEKVLFSMMKKVTSSLNPNLRGEGC